MLYSVEDVAIKLNVSKVTIYNKLKLKEYKDKVIKKAGKAYIDDDLLNLIKDSLKSKTDIDSNNIQDTTKEEIATSEADLLNLNKDFIYSLQSEIEFLRQQIQEKDKQLNAKDELLKNMQILIKQGQDKQENILQLEAHFKDLDTKLLNIRQEMDQRKKKNRPWIYKIFHHKE